MRCKAAMVLMQRRTRRYTINGVAMACNSNIVDSRSYIDKRPMIHQHMNRTDTLPLDTKLQSYPKLYMSVASQYS